MEDLQYNIEQAARRVFKLFLNSRLYCLNGKKNIHIDDLMGIKIDINYHGRYKKFKLMMEKKTVDSISEKLSNRIPCDTAESYDLMGEMANMIVGNASGDNSEGMKISPPVQIYMDGTDDNEWMVFSTKMGRFKYAIESCN